MRLAATNGRAQSPRARSACTGRLDQISVSRAAPSGSSDISATGPIVSACRQARAIAKATMATTSGRSTDEFRTVNAVHRDLRGADQQRDTGQEDSEHPHPERHPSHRRPGQAIVQAPERRVFEPVREAFERPLEDVDRGRQRQAAGERHWRQERVGVVEQLRAEGRDQRERKGTPHTTIVQASAVTPDRDTVDEERDPRRDEPLAARLLERAQEVHEVVSPTA